MCDYCEFQHNMIQPPFHSSLLRGHPEHREGSISVLWWSHYGLFTLIVYLRRSYLLLRRSCRAAVTLARPKVTKTLPRLSPLRISLISQSTQPQNVPEQDICSAVHFVIYPIAPKSTGAIGDFFFARHVTCFNDEITDTRHFVSVRFATNWYKKFLEKVKQAFTFH